MARGERLSFNSKATAFSGLDSKLRNAGGIHETKPNVRQSLPPAFDSSSFFPFPY